MGKGSELTWKSQGQKGKKEITISYRPHPKQAAFHKCKADVVLFGGSAGPGKTTALLWEAFMQCLESPGNHGILMRRSYPELEKSLILESLKLFPREICKYNEIKHRWTFKTRGSDSHLDFGFCKVESDVYTHQSAQYGFLGIDELTHWSYFQFSYLMSRVRTASPDIWPRIRCASNPGNIGHGWVKEYFGITKYPQGISFKPPPCEEDPQPLSRCFIQARVTDNPHLMLNDPTYISRLQLLPPPQRRMLLEGDWSSFAGKFFTEVSPDHFCQPMEIPQHWRKWRCVDYGFTAPFCCLWIAQDPSDLMYYVYKELYMTGLRDAEQAQWIKRTTFPGEHIEYTVCDPSMGAKRGGTGSSPQENYAAEDVILVPGNNQRVNGWMSVRNLLALRPNGKPGVKVFTTCRNFKRELEEAITDEANPEDLNSDGSDHAIDAFRYFCSSRPEPAPIVSTDPYSGMDMATQREWKAFHDSIKKRALQSGANRTYNLNSD